MTDWVTWLTAPAAVLRRNGWSPEMRLDEVGHARPLRSRWVHSIGMWCTASAADIRLAVGLDDAASRPAYDMFRSRNQLHTVESHVLAFYSGDIDTASFKQYAAIHIATSCFTLVNLILAENQDLPLGRIASAVAPQIGVLPVEVVLYHQLLGGLLESESIQPSRWLKFMPIEERAALWHSKGCKVQVPPRWQQVTDRLGSHSMKG